MSGRIIRFLIITWVVVSTGARLSFAQQALFSPREEMMLFTLDNLNAGYDIDEAVRGAVIETQMKLAESSLPGETTKFKKPAGEGVLKSLKKRTHPYINFTTFYDSSVDDSGNNPKKDMVFDTAIGSKINFTGRNRALNFDTKIITEYYNKFTKYDGVDAYAGFSSYVNIHKYVLSMNESYKNNYLSNIKELGGRDEIFTREGILKRRWFNTNSTTLSRYFNRLGFDVGYTRIDEDYEPAYSYNDRFVDTGVFNTYLRIATKTRLILGYMHEREFYRKIPGVGNTDTFTLTVTGALSPKITYSAGPTYKNKNSKPDLSGTSLLGNFNLEDFTDLNLISTFSYAFSNRTNFSFNYNYLIHDYQIHSDSYTSNSFSLNGNHRFAFNPKFNLSFSCSTELKEYPKAPLNDAYNNNYGFFTSLSYAFRQWLDFSFGGSYYITKGNYFVDEDSSSGRDYKIFFSTNARF